MLITRPLRGVARGVLNVSPRRSLSAATSFAARPRPRPAPKKSGALPSLQNGPVELQLPPVALLKSAKKSGVLDIEPDRALSILRDYAEISTQRLPGTWEKRFCEGWLRGLYITCFQLTFSKRRTSLLGRLYYLLSSLQGAKKSHASS